MNRTPGLLYKVSGYAVLLTNNSQFPLGTLENQGKSAMLANSPESKPDNVAKR